MRDSIFRLQDKTIFLTGPFNGTTQAIVRTLTEFGSDVAYFAEHTYAARYVDGVNEAREAHPEYGRAAHFAMPLKNEAQMLDALGKVTETLGRMDVLIDATPMAWDPQTAEAGAATSTQLAEKLIPFFLAKQRGRLIYLFDDAAMDQLRNTPAAAAQRELVLDLVKKLAMQYRGQNVTANAISIGVTEDFLQKFMPASPSLRRTLEGLQKDHPGIKLVESNDVASGVAYLASALSASLTGQLLRLTHGYHL